MSVQKIFDFYALITLNNLGTFQNHVQFSGRTLKEELMNDSQLIY